MAQTPGALYFSHMRDGPLIRIRLPGGRVKAAQLRAMADLAATGGNGRMDLTNLANIQIRGLHRVSSHGLKRALAAAGLLPRSLWADRLRNILADPLAGLVHDEIIDSTPVVRALDKALQGEAQLKALSPKFGFAVDGGGPGRISAIPHDAALIAERSGEDICFRLHLSGRATVLAAAPDEAPALALAAAKAAMALPHHRDSLLVRRWRAVAFAPAGALAIKALARLALALGRPRENRFRRLLDDHPFDRIENAVGGHAGRTGLRRPPVPVKAQKGPRPQIGPVAQRDGRFACGLGVPLGRLDVALARQLAALSERFGQGELRLSPWHVAFIPHVRPADVEDLLRASTAAGFVCGSSFLRFAVAACSGREGCRGARLDTPGHARAVMAALEGLDGGGHEKGRRLSVHVAGCSKGCARRTPADILALESEDAAGYRLYGDSVALSPRQDRRLSALVSPEALPQAIAGLVRDKTRQEGDGQACQQEAGKA